jgi:hypothetical protein
MDNAITSLVVPAINEDGNSTTPNGSSFSSARSSPTPATSIFPPSTPQRNASFASSFITPPIVNEQYLRKDALDDLPGVSYALELFLQSHMLESEEYCHKHDPKKYVSLVIPHISS